MRILSFILGSIRTNTYLLCEGESCIIIDPGCDGEGILEKINRKGLKTEKILLTHGHFDHILGAEVIRRKTGAPLCIHAFDAELLADPKKSYAMQFAGLSTIIAPAEILLQDGDIIDFYGNTIKVLHTPGHTKGSVSFITDEVIFTGDTLFHNGIGRCDLYGGNVSVLENSLKIFKTFEKDYKIYPGHGNHTTLSYEKRTNPYLI